MHVPVLVIVLSMNNTFYEQRVYTQKGIVYIKLSRTIGKGATALNSYSEQKMRGVLKNTRPNEN